MLKTMIPETFTPELLRGLELRRISARRAFLGSRQGGHVSPKRGHGIEFSDYRKYEPGDDPRHIDWGVYARSDRVYVKRFQEEQDLTVSLILDGSASMHFPSSENKWRRCSEIALAFTYVSLIQQDRVLISVPGIFQSPFYSGAKAFRKACTDLLHISGEENPSSPHMHGMQTFTRSLSQLRHPGVCIYISDFLFPFEEIEKQIQLLRSKNLDLSIIQVLGPADFNPLLGGREILAVDSETGQEQQLNLDQIDQNQYQELFQQHTKKIEALCQSAQIGFIQTSSGVDLHQLLLKELPGQIFFQ